MKKCELNSKSSEETPLKKHDEGKLSNHHLSS